MADLLVKLYDLPELEPVLEGLREERIKIYRAIPSQKHLIIEWVGDHFFEPWSWEVEAAIEQRPVTCFIAVQKSLESPSIEYPYDQPPELLLGFACYDVVARGMFGPTGVREDFRGRGIGKALLLACLHAMLDEGYAYAVIGWAGPVDYYVKTVGATIIDGSEPGPFHPPLRLD